MILVNFKVYKESFGEEAIKLAEICKKVEEKSKVKIYPVVSALDAYRIKKETGAEVILQSNDGMIEGARTGKISIKQALMMGIKGSLINHSEDREKPGTVKKRLKEWPNNFWSIVCLQTLGQMEGWAKKVKANFIAYEPKELIGNKEKSVATEKPEIIKKFVDYYKDIPVLVGAGIHSQSDVKTAIALGAKGVLVASDVVTAEDPEKELTEIALGFDDIILK